MKVDWTHRKKNIFTTHGESDMLRNIHDKRKYMEENKNRFLGCFSPSPTGPKRGGGNRQIVGRKRK
jgi:hypothetical protein